MSNVRENLKYAYYYKLKYLGLMDWLLRKPTRPIFIIMMYIIWVFIKINHSLLDQAVKMDSTRPK